VIVDGQLIMDNKILLVIDSLGSGGAQNQITLLAVELKEAGYDVHLFTYFREDFFLQRILDKGIVYHHLEKRGKIGFNVIRGLVQLINKEEYHTVISYLRIPNFYAAIAKRWCKNKFKLILSYRSLTDFRTYGRAEIMRSKWVNSVADCIVANSHHERERWQKYDPKNAAKWKTIYNAVDTSLFYPDDHIPKKNYFLVVGSVSKFKNGMTVLEALTILKDKGSKAKVLWIGEKIYHLEDRKDYLESMEKYISAYGLQNHFEWKDPVQNIGHYYNECRALILASKTEGLPNVVCEAMSCGTPCIVSNVLDHPLLIEEGKSGFLFNPDDAGELANKMEAIMKLPEMDYNKMKEDAYNKSKDLYSMDIFIEQYRKVVL